MRPYYQRRPLEEDSAHEWLMTFSDAVTLLLAFFVMLVSVSKVDLVTFEQVQAGIARHLGQRTVAPPATRSRKTSRRTAVSSFGFTADRPLRAARRYRQSPPMR